MPRISSTRSGRYVAQPTGYEAFIPTPLPPLPPVEMNNALWTLLSKADRSLGRLDGSTEALPNPDLFLLMYMRKEAVLSAQIEGTQASLNEVLELEARVLDPHRPSDAHEIVNYIAAMNHGLRRLVGFPLSLRLIREIHERVLAASRGGEKSPGEFRTSQNWIGSAGSTLATAKFVPPPPEAMREALGDLEIFLHDSTPMPVLVKIGLAHAQFETVHPFLDGNGRVGRLLITFLLCEQNVLQRPLLYLSYYFKQNREEYYERLQAVRDHGAWEEWIAFFLAGVVSVAQSAADQARAIVRMRERHRDLITGANFRNAGNALRLLDSLYDHPILTVNSAAESLSLPFYGVNVSVTRLVELGILEETTGRKRNRVYVYREYLHLFSDEEFSPDDPHLTPLTPEATMSAEPDFPTTFKSF